MQECGRCRTQKDEMEFSPSYRGRLGTWCRACFAEYNRQRKHGITPTPSTPLNRPARTCGWCGLSYQPKQDRPSEFCSRQCKDAAHKADLRAATLARKPTDRRCAWCGTDMPQAMRADAAFCSADCNGKAHRTMRNWRRRAGESAPLRPRKDPLPSFIDIAERDGWRCGICGKPVNQRRTFPDPLAGSLDHLLPVSCGGGHDPSNLQLAHFRCNWSKRADAVNDQLRLIG